jgi:hypothetical protein
MLEVQNPKTLLKRIRAVHKKSLLAIALLTVAAGAQSGTPNDRGISVNPANFNFAQAPVIATGRGAICPPAGPVSAAFTGATGQLGRIFRDGIPGVCPTKPYPGIFNATTTYNYETFTYTNTGAAAACVTVNFDPDTVAGVPCGTNAHASVYQGTYDPANQAANFLNDVGSSVQQPFSFEIAAGQNMVLVVTNTSAAAICDFAFEVVDLPCAAGSPTLGVSTTTLDFGGQLVGASTLRTLTVSNVGTAPLQVTGIAAPTAPFAVAAGGTCAATPFTLAPAATCTVNYRFAPTTAGTFNSPVAITSDGGDITVNLTGRGVVSIPLNALSGWNTALLLSLLGLSTLVLLRRRD